MTGIIAYGSYIPKLRIKVEEIARVWGKDGEKISSGLGIKEKSVACIDEDACTLAVEAVRTAISDFSIDVNKIGALYFGSESPPYAVKPTAGTVIKAIQAGPDITAADLEFACKAGTAGMQMCFGMVNANMIKIGVIIGSDTAQGRPNDALEFATGCGAVAMFIGNENVIAEINDTCSFTTDTPDFWRKPYDEFPEHAGRFTGEPAYFHHTINAAKMIMRRNNLSPTNFKYAVFHQPNAKFPLQAARKLGFKKQQVMQGLVAPYVGNTYSGAAFLGLASVLDKAQPGEKILVVSYGSGAGSDAFIITKTSEKKARVPVWEMVKNRKYIDYALYARHRNKIR